MVITESTHSLRCLRYLLVSASLVTLTGCPAPYDMWIEGPSSNTHAIFGIGVERGKKKTNPLERIAVEKCNGYSTDLALLPEQTVWVARSADPRGVPGVSLVNYGTSINGMVDSVPPQALTPGCYSVIAFASPGTAGLQFWVDADGKVREPTRHEIDSSTTMHERYIESERAAGVRASTRCGTTYKAVATADTVRAGQGMPFDTTHVTPIKCGDLRSVTSR